VDLADLHDLDGIDVACGAQHERSRRAP
jgi:hypothetical protein